MVHVKLAKLFSPGFCIGASKLDSWSMHGSTHMPCDFHGQRREKCSIIIEFSYYLETKAKGDETERGTLRFVLEYVCFIVNPWLFSGGEIPLSNSQIVHSLGHFSPSLSPPLPVLGRVIRRWGRGY